VEEKCSGFYYQKYGDGTVSPIMELRGDNTPGELLLVESDKDGVSAQFHLKKRLGGNRNEIAWEGTLQNIRENSEIKQVTFSRLRKQHS
jgi:hypothetical protein